ncbi:putative RNA methyltransferase [Williamsia serinedens]|uniref:23S rRNA (Guanine745-N1)-methyltransferase n=1 Tax=Williamsia serinedens TaxID=391736 RepID=A0ABT1H5K4_9NOCA|nr:methyltransferase domain-containing protein [Williamsia serinedens]MCP2161122.1 23S rRNA (guanine745-N1)-methyltransferase [Williamsia serinedens]
MTLASVVDLLACPVCGGEVDIDDRSVICDRGHVFDIARQGYVSLLAGGAHGLRSDTPEMIAARDRVQGAGHFGPVTDALLDVTVGEAVLDVGAGTGHHLAQVVADAPDRRGVGLDLSKPGARAIARVSDRIGAVVADAWAGLPVRDGVVDTVLSVFSPRNVGEFARVLGPGGRVVVVAPTPRHLGEIVAPMGMIGVDPTKSDRLGATMSAAFTRRDRRLVEYAVDADRDLVADLVAMGPSAHHVAPAQIADRAAAMPASTSVTVSTTVSVYEASA